MREVAVMMCDDPAVREVYKNKRGSFSSEDRSIGAAMAAVVERWETRSCVVRG